ncbi:MAG: hypothetical protein ACI861_001591 [Paracoccaceae bacterium]
MGAFFYVLVYQPPLTGIIFGGYAASKRRLEALMRAFACPKWVRVCIRAAMKKD